MPAMPMPAKKHDAPPLLLHLTGGLAPPTTRRVSARAQSWPNMWMPACKIYMAFWICKHTTGRKKPDRLSANIRVGGWAGPSTKRLGRRKALSAVWSWLSACDEQKKRCVLALREKGKGGSGRGAAGPPRDGDGAGAHLGGGVARRRRRREAERVEVGTPVPVCEGAKWPGAERRKVR